MIEVTTDVRPRTGGRVAPDANVCGWAGVTGAVYVGRGDEATGRGFRRGANLIEVHPDAPTSDVPG